MRPYMEDGTGGVILAPHLKLLCAYPLDGDSQDKVCLSPHEMTFYGQPFELDGAECTPGCFPPSEFCSTMGIVGFEGTCSYPPTELCDAIAAQASSGHYRNNEMIIEAESIRADPASAIEGFFMVIREGAHQEEADRRVRDAHAAFVVKYGFDPEFAPPLVYLDLKTGGATPFKLA